MNTKFPYRAKINNHWEHPRNERTQSTNTEWGDKWPYSQLYKVTKLHQNSWNNPKIMNQVKTALQITKLIKWNIYRRHKKLAYMVSVNKSITQPSLEISPIWIPIISEVKIKVKVISVYATKPYEGGKV